MTFRDQVITSVTAWGPDQLIGEIDEKLKELEKSHYPDSITIQSVSLSMRESSVWTALVVANIEEKNGTEETN